MGTIKKIFFQNILAEQQAEEARTPPWNTTLCNSNQLKENVRFYLLWISYFPVRLKLTTSRVV